MIIRIMLVLPLLLFSCNEKNSVDVNNSNEKISNISNINVETARELIQEHGGDNKLVILDVRTPREFKGGHIAGARNINCLSNDFSERIKALDRGKIYLVYCRSGNRSSSAMPLFDKLGFKKVYNLSGGTMAWAWKGYEFVE